jgi:Protein of unknown function (DUF2637)
VSARLARWATALAVLAVATIAAIVSYAHVESVALANGYSIGTARLSPFSVDGLLLASSLALANGARPWLARTGLVLGILATMAANAVYGAGHGPVGIMVNMWPSVAFLLASEILLSIVRARPVADEAGEEVHAANVTSAEEDQADDEVPARVLPMPTADYAPRMPAKTRPTRAKRQPDPSKVFAAELADGRVPSLRAVKERMHVGTDNARIIREELAVILRDVVEAA